MGKCSESLGAIWRESLVPGCTEENFADGLYGVLAEYAKKPLSEIRSLGENSQRQLDSEWKPEHDKDSRGYYKGNTTYLYNLIHWHVNYGEAEARTKLMLYLKEQGKTSILDFGAGVGSTSMLYASNGFKVAAADIAEPLLSFINWRMKRRGYKCSIYNLNNELLPKDSFDAVSAIDVLEHVNDPGSVLQSIYDSLHDGGLVCFNVCGNSGEPMHITGVDDVLCHMKRIGFERINGHDVPLYIYKKVQPSRFAGAVWYGYYKARKAVRFALLRLGIFEAVKRVIMSLR